MSQFDDMEMRFWGRATRGIFFFRPRPLEKFDLGSLPLERSKIVTRQRSCPVPKANAFFRLEKAAGSS